MKDCVRVALTAEEDEIMKGAIAICRCAEAFATEFGQKLR